MSLNVDSLQKLLVHELKDIYSAESQMSKMFGSILEQISDEDLKSTLTEHEGETKIQLGRLNQVFQRMEFESGGHRCKGMEGLLAELKETVSEIDSPEVKDAAIISMLQRVEHYEIAAYGTARTYAEKLGDYETSDILQQSLDEEAKADQRLSRLAERAINFKAMNYLTNKKREIL